ncbi:TPA: hypothetical protein UM516_002366 [Stenotrophomonas maltophilia]|nr:hypothetical protein [Stenotrophomonas maltophilia]
MSELCFNELSLPVDDRCTLTDADILGGMAQAVAHLVNQRVSAPVLRASLPLSNVEYRRGISLYDAIVGLGSAGRFRDDMLLLRRIAQKVPCGEGCEELIQERFSRCQAKVDGRFAVGLLWAGLADFLSLSLVPGSKWDKDNLQISVEEIDLQLNISESFVSVPNVCTLLHAIRAVDEARLEKVGSTNTVNFWNQREEIFPGLDFGLDVERQVAAIDEGLFRTILKKLNGLNQASLEWSERGGASPPWKSVVSPESERAKGYDRVMAERTFRDPSGVSKFFELHAKYGSAGRIHLIADRGVGKVVIGYIGPHLWLPPN